MSFRAMDLDQWPDRAVQERVERDSEAESAGLHVAEKLQALKDAIGPLTTEFMFVREAEQMEWLLKELDKEAHPVGCLRDQIHDWVVDGGYVA